MTDTKIIYKLPDLQPHQEWACEQGCTVHKPKHYKNVYSQQWDADGNLVQQLFEKYWTCQQGHLLLVWDNNTNDYAELAAEFYEEPSHD